MPVVSARRSLDFLYEQLGNYIDEALAQWDQLEGMHYWLFWPFQKSLCCYGESAKISRGIAYRVFERAAQMLVWLIHNEVPTAPGAFGRPNWKKWTLSAVLFGLRV